MVQDQRGKKTQPGLARLGSNGRVDPEFAAECRPDRGFTNEVQALAMFPDDSMLAAGAFVGASNSRVPYVARFWSGRMPSLSIEHDTHARIIGPSGGDFPTLLPRATLFSPGEPLMTMPRETVLCRMRTLQHGKGSLVRQAVT